MDTIMSEYVVPSQREMLDTLTSAETHPSNYTSSSQLAMLDRYAYLTGNKYDLNPDYHSPSQIVQLQMILRRQ